jgi:hypothetical protein
VVAFCALLGIVLISVQDVKNSRAPDFKDCACFNSRSSEFPYRGTCQPVSGEVSIGRGSIAHVYEIVMKTNESARRKANLKTEDTAETTQPKALQVGTTRIPPKVPGD